MKSALTSYYMNKAMEILEENFGKNLSVAIRVEEIDKRKKQVTLKIGLYDGTDFITIFGIAPRLTVGSTIQMRSEEGLINSNFKDWVHSTTEGIDWESLEIHEKV